MTVPPSTVVESRTASVSTFEWHSAGAGKYMNPQSSFEEEEDALKGYMSL
jgi:hypothetical protein